MIPTSTPAVVHLGDHQLGRALQVVQHRRIVLLRVQLAVVLPRESAVVPLPRDIPELAAVRVYQDAVVRRGPVPDSPDRLMVRAELALEHPHLFVEGRVALWQIDLWEAVQVAVDDQRRPPEAGLVGTIVGHQRTGSSGATSLTLFAAANTIRSGRPPGGNSEHGGREQVERRRRRRGRRGDGNRHPVQPRRDGHDRHGAGRAGRARVGVHRQVAGHPADALFERGDDPAGLGEPAGLSRLRRDRGRPVGLREDRLPADRQRRRPRRVGAQRRGAAGGRRRGRGDLARRRPARLPRGRGRGMCLRTGVRLRRSALGHSGVRRRGPQARCRGAASRKRCTASPCRATGSRASRRLAARYRLPSPSSRAGPWSAPLLRRVGGGGAAGDGAPPGDHAAAAGVRARPRDHRRHPQLVVGSPRHRTPDAGRRGRGGAGRSGRAQPRRRSGGGSRMSPPG